MALTTADLQPFQSGDVRAFVQRYKPSPLNAYEYFGRIQLDSVSQSRSEKDRVRVPSDLRRRAWITADRVTKDIEPSSNGFSSVADRELKEDWFQMFQDDEDFQMQLMVGEATTDPLSQLSWTSKLLMDISSLTELTLGDSLNALSGDENAAVQLTGSISFDELRIITKIIFGETGAAATVRAVLDAQVRWTDEGHKWYVLMTNLAATNPSEVLVGEGRTAVTWTNISPTALSTDGLCERCYIVGDYLLLTRETATLAHYWSLLSDLDAGNDGFTEVTGSYTAAKGPKALYARSSAQIIVVGAGGYIYELASPTSQPTVIDAGVITTQDLNDIHGLGRQIVMVGASNAHVVSNDGGVTYSVVVGPAVGVALNTVWVFAKDSWFIGDAAGDLWYTENAGVTWTQISIDAAIDSIARIRFFDKNVGYMAVTASAASVKGRTYRTTDSGGTWTYTGDISNGVVADTIDAIAVANQNKILSGGLKSGTDGVAQIAS